MYKDVTRFNSFESQFCGTKNDCFSITCDTTMMSLWNRKTITARQNTEGSSNLTCQVLSIYDFKVTQIYFFSLGTLGDQQQSLLHQLGHQLGHHQWHKSGCLRCTMNPKRQNLIFGTFHLCVRMYPISIILSPSFVGLKMVAFLYHLWHHHDVIVEQKKQS